MKKSFGIWTGSDNKQHFGVSVGGDRYENNRWLGGEYVNIFTQETVFVLAENFWMIGEFIEEEFIEMVKEEMSGV